MSEDNKAAKPLQECVNDLRMLLFHVHAAALTTSPEREPLKLSVFDKTDRGFTFEALPFADDLAEVLNALEDAGLVKHE